MPGKKLLLPLLLLFSILFNLFFWKEKLALNLVLFGFAVAVASLALNKGAIARTNVRLTAAGTLLAGLFVLLYASDISRWAFVLSFLTFLGFVNSPQFRSVPFALFTGFFSWFTGWAGLATALGELRMPGQRKLGLGRIAAMGIVPVALLLLFGVLFSQANPRFGKMFQVISVDMVDLLLGLFEGFNPLRVAFFLFGGMICIGLLFSYRWKRLEHYDANAKQQLARKRRRPNRAFSMSGLRKEHKIALLTVISINLLTLANNVIDINWIWFGFEYDPEFNLTQFVHEGTYLLIFSILLAMSVMFFFFRGNLNFLRNNKALRIASYVWIAQNFIMVCSVGLRNYHYISHWGLAYKRIGVFFFLVLTAFGLVSLFLKIYRKKSLHHVVRVNAWATYAVMLLLALVNWDAVIMQYNFARQNKESLDVEFHMGMSDKMLPLLDQNRDLIEGAMVRDRNFIWEDYDEATELLDRRIENFMEEMENRSWLSWNLADARAMSYFEAKFDRQ